MMALLDDSIVLGGTLMHHRIDTILKRIRQDVALHLDPESINAACRANGYRWRQRILTPVVIIHWFVTQILLGNTSIEHISLLAKRRFTGEAYCLARAALPLAVFQTVLRNLILGLVPITTVEGRWKGHRTWLVDGSSFSMPDTPELQKAFGQPSEQAPGCGFPVAKILVLFHAGTGMLIDVKATPLRSHEMAGVAGIHPSMKPNDILIGDRGFSSFAHLAILSKAGIHAVFRAHQRQIVDFTPHRPHAEPGQKKHAKGRPRSRWIRTLGIRDQLVEMFKPEDRPDWMTAEEYAQLPETLMVRELQYEVCRPGTRTRWVTLVTTLTDAEVYSVESLANLYASRWRVETNFKHLKTTMKLDVLKCKTKNGVLRELMVYGIVYNLVRLVMVEGARRQGVDVERISFVDAQRWLAKAEVGEDLPRLVVNPHRPGLFEPRVRKRRPKQFPVMQKPRSELRNALQNR